MNLKYFLLTGCNLLLLSATSFSQNSCILKLDREGISVYTKDLDNSPFKAVKTVSTIHAYLSRLTAVLLNIKSSTDWVYSTKSALLLKQASPSELFYYSEITVPWPVDNRAFIVRLKVNQDAKTKVVTVEGENKPTYLPEKKNVVRIQESNSKWVMLPQVNGQVKIEYELQVDPGGLVPAWLINLFATKGAYELFKNLRVQEKKPVYANPKLPFIKD